MARSLITISQSGNFKNIEGFFKRTKKRNLKKELEKYGEKGVELLASATPKKTGVTASSWYYEIVEENGQVSINFCNSSMIGATPIVILIRYGHATRNGGFVEGNDFVTPIIEKLFKEMADTIWKEVTGK